MGESETGSTIAPRAAGLMRGNALTVALTAVGHAAFAIDEDECGEADAREEVFS